MLFYEKYELLLRWCSVPSAWPFYSGRFVWLIWPLDLSVVSVFVSSLAMIVGFPCLFFFTHCRPSIFSSFHWSATYPVGDL